MSPSGKITSGLIQRTGNTAGASDRDSTEVSDDVYADDTNINDKEDQKDSAKFMITGDADQTFKHKVVEGISKEVHENSFDHLNDVNMASNNGFETKKSSNFDEDSVSTGPSVSPVASDDLQNNLETGLSEIGVQVQVADRSIGNKGK